MKKFLLSLIICLFVISASGCIFNNPCNTGRAHNLASKVSKEGPSKFVKKITEESVIYHEKNLIYAITFLGNFVKEGKGISIEIWNDRDQVAVKEQDSAKTAKLYSGEIKFSEAELTIFGYVNNEEGGEKIGLYNYGSVVFYVNSDDGWIKRCYDPDEFDESQEFELIPFLSSKKVDEKEVKKFLDLVEKIKKKFPPR